MNRHLGNAIIEAEKVEALMTAIDELYMEDAPDQLQYLHMTAMDVIRRLKEELEKLSEDKHVVDVIYAVNEVRGNH